MIDDISVADTGLFWAKTFAKGISDAVLVVDAKGTLLWFNHAAKKFFQLTKTDNGESVAVIFESPVIDEYLTQQKVSTLELPLPEKPDQVLSMVLIPYGAHFLLIGQDAAYRHHIDRMRQDFVANVSHEMRTPLTVIAGYLEMISAEVSDALPHWAPYMTQMQQQMTRLEELLEELLLLSKLQSHEVDDSKLQMVDVPLLLQGLIEDAKRLSDSRHTFSSKIEQGLLLRGNEKELKSCFGNLLTNAVRYSPDGGRIDVVWYKDKTGKHFYVKDQGIGVAQKHIPRLTERFYRVDKGRSRQTGGTGLGLSIVKHVLIRHKAVLYIQSELGQGSLFRCDFNA
ncbi:phosphate regulon sensor histidine kinase PhoR [Facilibium subflavum]|uniref:phosphate regulon sensor histidine kinase PhoR n=1 Tax=Facilibium subflavum TaxID=2219058 RepID=UPI000E6500AB|nr:phosphate regulon sensor histidine kinase PhoR [Facilibium subflavum]